MAEDKTIYVFLAYFFGWIGGLIMYFVKSEDKTIRFHAARSMILFLGGWVLSLVLAIIPIIGALFSLLISLFLVFVWFYTWIKALVDKGEKFTIPLVGFVDKYAEELANK